MPATVTCSCGKVLRGNEGQLYGLIRAHVDRWHPEQHRRVSAVREADFETERRERVPLAAARERG